MRHRVYGKHLGRNKDQRKNLFKALVYSLLSHGTIQTSEAKAKAIKGLVDKVITSAKNKDFSKLQSFVSDQTLKKRLTSEIIPKLGTRASGFTSIVRLGTRLGDQTTMVRMSLIGAEQLSVPSSRLSDKSKSTVSQPVTGKPKTGKPKSENRRQKTDVSKGKESSAHNKKTKKVSPRRKK